MSLNVLFYDFRPFHRSGRRPMSAECPTPTAAVLAPCGGEAAIAGPLSAAGSQGAVATLPNGFWFTSGPGGPATDVDRPWLVVAGPAGDPH